MSLTCGDKELVVEVENDPFETTEQSQLDELSEAVRDEDATSLQIELGTLTTYIDAIADRVSQRLCVGMVIVDASNLGTWERQHGAIAFTALMNQLARSTQSMLGTTIRQDDVICFDAPGSDTLLVFLGAPRELEDDEVSFEEVVQRIKRDLYLSFDSIRLSFHEALEQVALGSALIIRNDSVDPRREVYRAIRQARIDAQVHHRELERNRHRVIGHMISQRRISTLYQRIMNLASREIVGYEALSRAQPTDADRLGVHLFVAAARAQLEGELDQTCRQLSIKRRPVLNSTLKLFVNCLPQTFFDLKELEVVLDAWTQDGLEPGQLVFEVTENITHEQLRRIQANVSSLRKRGYRFALDDVGTGTTNLQLLADLEPDYIKMDITLTRGIAQSDRKQALATYLLELSDRFDANLIAEGIESQADLDTVKALGVKYGQGFLLGRPEVL